jgi:hypothetical protein
MCIDRFRQLYSGRNCDKSKRLGFDAWYVLMFFSHLSQKVIKLILHGNSNYIGFSGVCMRSRQNFSQDSINFAPFVLVPSAFPKKEFEKAIELQTLVNEMIHQIANNYEFLKSTLAM